MVKPSLEPVRVLGVDPGTRKLGYGVVERQGTRFVCVAQGVVDVSNEADFLARLVRLADELGAIIVRHKPMASAIEQVFAGRNIKTAIRSAEGRGAVLLTLAHAHLPVTEYATRAVKQAVTGRGGAAKQQVGMMVKTLLNLKAEPEEDAADALAVAICHLQQPSAGQVGMAAPTQRRPIHRVVPDPREVLASLIRSRSGKIRKAAGLLRQRAKKA